MQNLILDMITPRLATVAVLYKMQSSSSYILKLTQVMQFLTKLIRVTLQLHDFGKFCPKFKTTLEFIIIALFSCSLFPSDEQQAQTAINNDLCCCIPPICCRLGTSNWCLRPQNPSNVLSSYAIAASDWENSIIRRPFDRDFCIDREYKCNRKKFRISTWNSFSCLIGFIYLLPRIVYIFSSNILFNFWPILVSMNG